MFMEWRLWQQVSEDLESYKEHTKKLNSTKIYGDTFWGYLESFTDQGGAEAFSHCLKEIKNQQNLNKTLIKKHFWSTHLTSCISFRKRKWAG